MSKMRKKKLKTPTTLKRHIGKHRESISNAGKKQRLSEPEDINEEFPSISLDHHAPDTERIDLQADSSSSFPSTSHLEKDTAILIAMNALSLSLKKGAKEMFYACRLGRFGANYHIGRKWEEVSHACLSKNH